jgi:glycosyltransferase involved in cell wall biosynthesis
LKEVFLNGRFLSQAVTGVQRYAGELIKALGAILAERAGGEGRASFTVLAPPGAGGAPALGSIPIREVGRLRGHAWEQLELAVHSRSGLLVSLANSAPLVRRRQLVTIHDAGVFAQPQAYSFAFRTWYRCLLRGLARRARAVITDSTFSREEIQRYCPAAGARVRVVFPGGDHLLAIKSDEEVFRRLGIGERPYLLAVGSRNPLKNHAGIGQALGQLPGGPELVIAGREDRRVFGRAVPPPPDRVRWAGYVTDGELRALYQRALCLVHPSFYEGFGLPPLEAMSLGCPVVASRAASLPEVLGEAALYCDPASPDDIARRVAELFGDPALRDELRRRGLERARRFRWRDCAEGLFSLIEEFA